MSAIAVIAERFFEACETGKGWEACRAYCAPDASFAAQSEPLAGITTLRDYAEWMKAFATDEERQTVCAYAVFSATHTGEGGPCPPTGKRTESDYVYVMEFAGDTVRHMTKIWNSAWAMKELGWA